MKILITGGHLTPALALIEAMPKNTQFIFAGRKHALEGDGALSLEYQTVSKLSIPFIEVSAGRLQRKFSGQTFSSLLKIPKGFFQAISILKKHKPDVVVGFGGYVSVPFGIAASFLAIPLVIHEQAVSPGLANKILSPFASRICISWEETRPFFPRAKTILTGLPIRKFSNQQLASSFQTKTKLPLIYITGGSQGSHFINSLIEQSLGELTKTFNILHQTGDAKEYGDFARLAKMRETLPREIRERYRVEKFIEPNLAGSVLSKVDLVISRSGINTIGELILFKKPALLIPLPILSEQKNNALFFKGLGFGEVLFQKDADPNLFVRTIRAMFDSLATYRESLEKSRGLVRESAAHILSGVIQDAAAKSKK